MENQSAITQVDVTQVNLGKMLEVLTTRSVSGMTAIERAKYYCAVCRSMNLNPITKPLDYIEDRGRISLYVNQTGAAQLREVWGISVKIVDRRTESDIYIVTAIATLPSGRSEEAIGAVPLHRTKNDGTTDKSAEYRANAMMKAETKAKRRATLSICGLGWMKDEDAPGQKIKAVVYDPPADVVDDDF